MSAPPPLMAILSVTKTVLSQGAGLGGAVFGGAVMGGAVMGVAALGGATLFPSWVHGVGCWGIYFYT